MWRWGFDVEIGGTIYDVEVQEKYMKVQISRTEVLRAIERMLVDG